MRRFSQSGSSRGFVTLFLYIAIISLSGCVKLVSEYDEVTDKAVTALQRKTESHLVALESEPAPPDCEYQNHTAFYSKTKVAISAVAVRAAAIPDNNLTLEQVRLLSDSLNSLEQLHKITCLAPEQIHVLRSNFNTSYTAILKLELAKRRKQ